MYSKVVPLQAATMKHAIQSTGSVLNISWVAAANEIPASIICPRSTACPRTDRCEDLPPTEDTTELSAIRRQIVMADCELADQLGQSARQFVLNRHDWDAMLAPLEALTSPLKEATYAA